MKKILCGLLAFILLLAPAAEAGRGFGATLGAGSTDKVTTGYNIAFPTQHTIAFWVWRNGTGGGALGRVYESTSTQNIQANQSITKYQVAEAFTTTQGAWQWPLPSDGVWIPMVIIYDGALTTNVPTVYVSGSSVVVNTSVTPVGTYTGSASAVVIGNRSTSDRNWDGKIANFTIWSGLLSAGEAIAYCKGADPLQIRPSSILATWPLFGNTAGERDNGPSHVAQTITGTAFQPSPPIIMNGPTYRAR